MLGSALLAACCLTASPAQLAPAFPAMSVLYPSSVAGAAGLVLAITAALSLLRTMAYFLNAPAMVRPQDGEHPIMLRLSQD